MVSISVVSVAVSAGGVWRGWRGIELTCALFFGWLYSVLGLRVHSVVGGYVPGT